jgi:flagellar biosynthesis repressor protein FlbT
VALKLSLKPGEKIVLNGAVIANGDRRSSLILHNKATILREKDIMQEQEADTPARRIYFPIMLIYMGQGKTEEYYQEFAIRMTEFMQAIKSPEIVELCVKISKSVMSQDYYRALMDCKKLIAFELERLP